MIKLQIMSDLHLEMRNAVFDFPQKAPNLVLAGDIGNPSQTSYQRFLYNQADRFDRVFVVKGNHCTYGRTLTETDELIQEICDKRDNLIYLNQTSYDLDDDHIILGTTLWSEMADDQRSDISCFLADMRFIKDWSFDWNNVQHAKEKAWLASAIKTVEEREKLAIVVTHHSPSFKGTVAPKYRGNSISSAFCTDLDHMLKLPVVCHVFGHSHYSCDQLRPGGCRLVSNQRGYPGEETGFDPEFIVEIE